MHLLSPAGWGFVLREAVGALALVVRIFFLPLANRFQGLLKNVGYVRSRGTYVAGLGFPSSLVFSWSYCEICFLLLTLHSVAVYSVMSLHPYQLRCPLKVYA